MKKNRLIPFLLGLVLISGCDGVDLYGANSDHAAEETEKGLDHRAEAFEFEEEQYQEYLDIVEEVKELRERNEELEEEIYYLTEERDWAAESYEYFCDYGYDEISDATYDELCN